MTAYLLTYCFKTCALRYYEKGLGFLGDFVLSISQQLSSTPYIDPAPDGLSGPWILTAILYEV